MLIDAGVMVGSILPYDRVIQGDEVQANRRVATVERWDGHEYGAVRSVYDVGGDPIPGRLPGLGEHTEEIMDELGRAHEVDDLVARGVISKA
jgi:crotonobetainyl-CoA:carnitine CoA-transferase CaiB-like acyl-CoA transferase